MDKEKNLGKIVFYCDESCHLKNDNSKYMSLASVFCRKDRVKDINKKIQLIKAKYNISSKTELKWGKVSSATLQMYKDIFEYIRSEGFLKIRILVANKEEIINQLEWYNKMYYKLLEFPIQGMLWNYKIDQVELFTDVKDTNSFKDMEVVGKYLSKHFYKAHNIQVKSRVCESYDVQLIQIADLLAGAATYKNRKISTSTAKLELISFIESKFNIKLTSTTKTKYGSFSSYNVFVWGEERSKNDF